MAFDAPLSTQTSVRQVFADKPGDDAAEEHRSLLGEAFHASAGLVFGDKSKVAEAATTYGPEALYTAALFFPGAKALGASAVIGALNEVRTGESLRAGATDAVLGSLKGAGTKFAFDKIGTVEFTKSILKAPIKGVVMGSTSTFINTGLTRGSYDKNGKFNFEAGVERTIQSVLSPQALAVDAATFGLASGATAGINRVTGGLLGRSPGLSTLLTGSTFGIASGGIQEVSKQAESGNGFDIGKIASQALLHGAIDGLAAGPAALKVGFTPKPIPGGQTDSRSVSSTDSKENAIVDVPLRGASPLTNLSPMPELQVKPVQERIATSESLPAVSIERGDQEGPRNSAEDPSKFGRVDEALDSAVVKGSKTQTAISELATTLSDGSELRVQFSHLAGSFHDAEPVSFTATDPYGRTVSIAKGAAETNGVAEWEISAPSGASFKVNADVRVENDGTLTVSGRPVDISNHNIDEVVSMFVTKPDITAGITAQLNTMQKILAPLEDPAASLEARNIAFRDINGFASDHRSPMLAQAIREWMPFQHPDIQSALARYYDSPVREAARHNSFLRDTAFELMREDKLSPQIIGHITEMADTLNRTEILTEEQKSETTRNVLTLLDNGNDPRMPEAEKSKTIPGLYRIAALQSAMHVADPDTITQFAHPTCALASLEVTAYMRAPDVATRLVSEVLHTGKFTITDGTVIQIDPFSLRPERGSDSIDSVAFNQHWTPEQFRSYASQIFQTAAANIYWQTRTTNFAGQNVPKGSLRYELRYPPAGSGESTPVGYVVDYSVKPIELREASGYTQHQIAEISDLISGKINFDYVPDHAFTDLDTFKSFVNRRPKDKLPVSVGVDARYLSNNLADSPDVLGHRINILTSFDPVTPGGANRWLVAIKNPWNGRADYITLEKLYEMSYMRPSFRGPIGQDSLTVVPVSKADFEKAQN